MPVGTGFSAVGDYLSANRGTLDRENHEMSAGTRAPNQPGDPGGSRGGIATYLQSRTGGNYTGSAAGFDASMMNPTAAPQMQSGQTLAPLPTLGQADWQANEQGEYGDERERESGY
ncbi:MAG: hypothetical protein ACYC9X_00750 [Dehalococcoidia bacterium]